MNYIDEQEIVLDKLHACDLIHRVSQRETPKIEEMELLKYLFENGYVDASGNISGKGIDELYH